MGKGDGRRQPAGHPPSATTLEEALGLHQAGRLAEAASLYQRVLETDPDNAEALHLLGVARLQAGAAAEAAGLIEQAVDRQPENPQFLNNLGEAYRALGRRADAAGCYRRAIALMPGDPAPHNNLGNALMAEGETAEAVASYHRALELAPDDPEVLTNLGGALREAGNPREAVSHLERALAIHPGMAEAHAALGQALTDLDRPDEAEAACRQAIQLRPDSADAYSNLGNALAMKGELEAAAYSYRKANSLEPANARTVTNLGNVLLELGKFEDAIACHRRAVAAEPDFVEAHHNLGTALLLTGRLEEGWREHEWRWRTAALARKKRPFPQPPWRGEDPAGKTILLWAEQGVGDEILYAGMVPDLVEAGARVVLECDRRMIPVFERSFAGVRVVAKENPPAAETQAPDIDYQVASASLGRWLRPDLGRFPGRRSYLAADAARTAALREKYAAGGDLVVGLAWVSKNPRVGRQKSMTLAALAPLAAVPGVRFVDLQYGDTAAARADFEAATGTTILHDEAVDQMADLDAFAAQVAAMDLVVTVSNTTAHMAGALGVPAWVMLHMAPLHCWMLGREDSPWYPSVRLYRQAARGEWAAVVERVAGDLKARAGHGA